MATITITVSDDALALAEKHAKELGYEDAADYAFELLRNHAATREDAHYMRMHTGEQNHVFGRSRREQRDAQHRAAAEAEAAANAKAMADRVAARNAEAAAQAEAAAHAERQSTAVQLEAIAQRVAAIMLNAGAVKAPPTP